MTSVLLAGGGHAHLYALRALLFEKTTLEVLLVSPSRYQYYSGMFSGFTEGIYDEEAIRIDLMDICTRAGVTFIQDTLVKFDPETKTAYGNTGQVYTFDVISFDIGSVTDASPSVQEHALAIKPNYLFPKHIEKLKRSASPVVAGGGAAGTELALSMLAWRKKYCNQSGVTLITPLKPLHAFGTRTANKMSKIAMDKGLRVVEGEKAVNITPAYVRTDRCNRWKHTGVLWLTGAKSSNIFHVENITTDAAGFPIVNHHLQSIDYPYVFGAGDCVTINQFWHLAKNGVYAVRQAPVLWKNITNYVNGKQLESFQPPNKFIAILSTGNKEALFTYGKFSVHSKWAWKLKHSIDKKFMEKYKK